MDAARNITTMAYDIRGRKTGMTDPDMGSWTYAYDALGNLTSQTDAKGQTTTMQYDQLGRMISRTEAEGTSTWAYDTQWLGALSSETNGIASKAYIYDTFGRVKSAATTINGQTYNVSTGYDTLGRVSTITYPTGIMIRRNYNAFHYLASVSNAASGAIIWQAKTMDEFGHLTGESFGNGVSTTHIYDAVRGTLTGLQSTSGGATIQSWSYNYDAIGNMKFRTDAVMGYTENFRYDNLNRLSTVHDAGGVLQKQYKYDAIGNITYKSDVGYYGYDPNHVHAVNTAGGNTYAYDANGNQISGAGRNLQWTSFNKPSGISTANGYTGFTYDANHNRVLKTTPTSTTAYIGKIYQQTTMNGIIKDVSHIYAGSKLVASIEEVAGLSTIKYMHGDHLGSISVITDANGAVIERLRFDVFGAPVDTTTGAAMANFSASNTDRGYTGHEMDASTGLINMNARLYDPVLGRFLSADTIVPSPGNMQAFNRYSYVLNNPLLYTDPTGHIFFIDDIAVAMLIGAIIGGVSAGIQSDWDFSAVMVGAFIGAVAGLAGFEAYGPLADLGATIAGATAGAAAGATAGFLGTMAAGGGKFFKNTANGAFFGAVGGAVTGGMIQELQVHDVIASMAGAFTSGTMKGGFDDGFIAVAYAAGAMAVSYVVRGGELGQEKSLQRAQDSQNRPKLEAMANDPRVRAEIDKAWVASNPDGTPKHEKGFWILKDNSLSVQQFPSNASSTRDSLIPGSMPDRAVAFFHTHPNTAAEGYIQGPSPADIRFANSIGIPGIIRSHSGMYYFGP